ncbi:MAG: ABC transporter ATP-binding protein [Polyangiaceae bacterium]
MKTDTPTALIRARGLTKEFRQGFFMRRVRAVESVSFEVATGDIFGFLGPNGAGKTTTIKILTGLIAATGGDAELFGESVRLPTARSRLGFLPENPYVYPYLTPTEFVELSGRLSGLSGKAARARTVEVLARVGMTYAADRPARKLSKGMLQRTGLAAALVADPELLILDEPMSGLDPVGRKEVRDLIIDERRKGRTIFFSSHILSDVETLCDKVAILQRGRVVVAGRLDELLRRGATYRDVVLADVPRERLGDIEARWGNLKVVADRVVLTVEGLERLQSLLTEMLSAKIAVVEVIARQETLEDLFLRHDIGRTERA